MTTSEYDELAMRAAEYAYLACFPDAEGVTLDGMRAAIRALPLPSPVAVQAVPEGWKPHDTAPYQTWVLAWLYLPKNPIASGPVIGQRCYVEKDEPESYPDDVRRLVGDWWVNGRIYRAGHVTHWRDLPVPPTEAASYLLPSPAGE